MSIEVFEITALRAALEQAAESELERHVPSIEPHAMGAAKVVAANLAAVLVSEVLWGLDHRTKFTASRESHIVTDQAATQMDKAVALVLDHQ